MSSRILRPGAEKLAEPMVWPSAGSAAEASQGIVPEKQAAGRGAQAEETNRRIREAHQAGFREGEAAGRSQAEPIVEQLGRTIQELVSLRPRLRREAEADCVQLSLAIARRVLHRELSIDPEAIEGLIRTALERLQAQEVYRLRIHPAQESAVRTCLERLGCAPEIEVVADRTLEPGAVLFETSRGSLDASVGTQLQEIQRGLADRLRRKS